MQKKARAEKVRLIVRGGWRPAPATSLQTTDYAMFKT